MLLLLLLLLLFFVVVVFVVVVAAAAAAAAAVAAAPAAAAAAVIVIMVTWSMHACKTLRKCTLYTYVTYKHWNFTRLGVDNDGVLPVFHHEETDSDTVSPCDTLSCLHGGRLPVIRGIWGRKTQLRIQNFKKEFLMSPQPRPSPNKPSNPLTRSSLNCPIFPLPPFTRTAPKPSRAALIPHLCTLFPILFPAPKRFENHWT